MCCLLFRADTRDTRTHGSHRRTTQPSHIREDGRCTGTTFHSQEPTYGYNTDTVSTSSRALDPLKYRYSHGYSIPESILVSLAGISGFQAPWSRVASSAWLSSGRGLHGRCTGRGRQPSLAARRCPRLLLHGRRSSLAVRRKTDLLLSESLGRYWPMPYGTLRWAGGL